MRRKSRTKSKRKSKTNAKKRSKRRSSSRAPDSLPTVSVDQALQHRSWAFYGRTGTSKTTLLGTFPKPILLLDINDRGVDSIAEYGDDIQVLRPKSWGEFEDVYWYLKKNRDEYATLGIDTVTELQELAVIRQLEEKTGKSLDFEDEEAQRAGDWGVLNQSDWGDVGALMKRYITQLRDLPLEVVFNAQIRTFGDDSYEDEALAPDVGARLSPATREHLNAMVNIIGNTFIRQRDKVVRVKRGGKRKRVRRQVTEYCLRVGPSAIYDTKFRKGKDIVLPEDIVNPTYDDILALVEGEE